MVLDGTYTEIIISYGRRRRLFLPKPEITDDNRMALAQNWRRRGMFDEVAFIFPNAPMIPITVVCDDRHLRSSGRLGTKLTGIELRNVHAGMVRHLQAGS